MGRRVDCPDCGAQNSAAQFERDGCWACARDEIEREEDDRFRDFMDLEESQRWRRLWEVTGKPTAY